MVEVIIFGAGVILGSIVTQIVLRIRSVGSLRIDNSDSDGPYLFLELSREIPNLQNKKHVVLDVKNENLISRK